MKKRLLIIGARGFIGSALVEALKKYEADIEVKLFVGDIRHRIALSEQAKNVDEIVNLVGLSPIGWQKPSRFQEIHVRGVQNILAICRERKLKKFIHVSALSADSTISTDYLQTKHEAEVLIRKSGIPYLVFAPAMVFDKGGELYSIMQNIKKLPVIPFPDLKAKHMPVYREDFAKFMAKQIAQDEEGRFEVVGPRQITVTGIFELLAKKYKKRFIKFPSSIAELLMDGLDLDNLPISTDPKVCKTDIKEWINEEVF